MNALQRLAALGACFLVGMSLCGVVLYGHSTRLKTAQSLPRNSRSEAHYLDLSIASRDATPEEVVAKQLSSLHAALTDPTQLKVCYSLASPENRKLTGPFDRFASMVMQPPYDQLARSTSWQAGSAQIDQNYAAVLVSTINSHEQPQAFRFLLRLHDRPPYEGCWLTDAVQVLQPMNDVPNAPIQSPEVSKID